MPALVLPGYDFDPVKNRYFKLAPGQSPRSTTVAPAEPSRPLPRKKRKHTHDLFLPATSQRATPSCASCPCSHTALIPRLERKKPSLSLMRNQKRLFQIYLFLKLFLRLLYRRIHSGWAGAMGRSCMLGWASWTQGRRVLGLLSI